MTSVKSERAPREERKGGGGRGAGERDKGAQIRRREEEVGGEVVANTVKPRNTGFQGFHKCYLLLADFVIANIGNEKK